mmetsp:Transcript_25408/g.82171  ORF Transcript_25408/g.82171 Transcript_25408/m.82171 type:complete len:215 (+) Transcript_25408:325-969(+)
MPKREREDDDEEDDDDDDDEEEGGAPPPPEFLPTMKGKVSLVEERLFWQGEWADSEKAYEEGRRSKFKYGGPADVSESALDAPPSGTWNGYFMNPTESDVVKIREKGVRLSFEATDDPDLFVVAGNGANDYGDFTVKGLYSAAKRQLDCTKTYGGADDKQDDDDDELDEADIDDDYDDELAGLHEEQDMPLEELAKRYGTELPAHQLNKKKKKK